MLTLSPQCFGSILGEAEFSDSVLHFPSFFDDQEIRCAGEDTTSSSPQFSMVKDDEQVKEVQKLNHNANERDRRKKINDLYKSLRVLLPPADQQKKLSIPTTVSRVVEYIPELEKEVKSLIQKKEKILNMISKEEEKTCHFQKKRKCYSNNSSSAITATQVNDKEIMVQVSIMESSRASFAQALFNLEQDGLLLLNSSVFHTSETRVFYNLHLQVETTTQVLELEGLKQKLFALFEKQQQHLPLLPIFSSNNYMESIF